MFVPQTRYFQNVYCKYARSTPLLKCVKHTFVKHVKHTVLIPYKTHGFISYVTHDWITFQTHGFSSHGNGETVCLFRKHVVSQREINILVKLCETHFLKTCETHGFDNV